MSDQTARLAKSLRQFANVGSSLMLPTPKRTALEAADELERLARVSREAEQAKAELTEANERLAVIDNEARLQHQHDSGLLSEAEREVAELREALQRIRGIADADRGLLLGDYGFRTIKDALFDAGSAVDALAARVETLEEVALQARLSADWFTVLLDAVYAHAEEAGWAAGLQAEGGRVRLAALRDALAGSSTGDGT